MKDIKYLQSLLSVCCRSILCFAFLALSFLLLFSSQLNAQSTGGRIRGTVTDSSGGAVAGATVTLINEATHSTRELQTGANGEYLFLEVPVGSYEINTASPGFKKYTRKGIPLDLNQVLSVDIPLQVGGSTETVEVTGAPPVVDTTSTQLGAVVNDRSSTQLPLNQRDVYQLLQLQPGVQSQLGNDLFFGSDKAGVVTVNGGRGRSNNYTVNGGDGNDLFVNGPAIEPSPDSVDEFRVITNNFDAEYGRNSGAVVNVVTKSGTNDLHGSFYEFFRNTVLNAQPFAFAATPKTPFNQNQFGGTLGGPIIKDKTFIFGSYEGRRIVEGKVSQPLISPSTAELNNGDFSGGGLASTFSGSLNTPLVASILQQRCGSGAPASLPASQQLSSGQQALVAGVAAGGAAVPYMTLFPNNQIPTGCYDPVALSLLQYLPSTPFTVPKSSDRGDQGQVRVDHSFSPNQKTSVYYYIDDDYTVDPFAKFQSFGAATGDFPSAYATRTQQVNVSHTSTIGSKAVNEARFNYFREGQGQFNTPLKFNAITASCGTGTASAFCFTGTADTAALNDACAAGIASLPGETAKDCGIHSGLGSKLEGVPFIFFGGTGLIGNNPGGQLPQTGNTFQWSDNYSRIIGSHSLKFGGDVRYQKFDQFLIFDINGDYTFNNTASTSASTVGFDNAIPNFLLGLPSGYTQGSPQHELIRSTSFYLFAQDSWKVKPNVTLNYGVRWELNTPLADAGHKVQTFRPGQQTTIYPCSLTPGSQLFMQFGGGQAGCDQAGVTPLGIVFPGDKGVPSGLTQTYYKAFAPRLGLNWSPGAHDGWLAKLTGGPGKTSVSMGYGIFYNPIEQLVLEQFNAEPPFGGSITVPDAFLQTPFITETGNASPNPFTGVLNPPRNMAIDWSRFLGSVYFGDLQPHVRPQYSDQYNLTIKRELPGDMLFQIGYVGSQGHRLLAIYEVNETNPQTCLEISALPGPGCAQFGEDGVYNFTLPAASQCAGLGLAANCNAIDLPYYNPAGITGTGPNVPCPPVHTPAGCHYVNTTGAGQPITLSGLRFYSSPDCNPLSGWGCNQSAPPISGIFAEDTVAHSNYNSLQVMVQKRFSHGIQFQGSYTFSKTLDNASSFEEALNPFNFNATYGLSAYDARSRFVFNVVWDLPIPKYEGVKGILLSGWEVSAIESLQSGFPVRIQSQADNELLDSTFNFEAPGEPNLVSRFHTVNPRGTVCAPGTGPLAQMANPNPPVPIPACQAMSGYTFDPNLFDNNVFDPVNQPFGVQLGTIGNSARTLCCGPGINNTDFSFSKHTQITERMGMEFRADIFNIWNHAQFYSTDGNLSDPTFGQPLHVHDPRLVQFALKFKF